jgi:hypothetical protein
MGPSFAGTFKCLFFMNFVMIGSESGGIAVGCHSQMFSGQPGSQLVEDCEDRLLAAYAKARLKDKKLTKAEFLLQLPGVLEFEALQLWRKKRDESLTEPKDGENSKVWDPLADVIKLFKEHFEVPSAEKVRKLRTLKKGEKKTCRMLKSRVERLAEETGLLNGRKQAITVVKALPAELCQRVESVLWAQSPSDLQSGCSIPGCRAHIELAQAYAAGMQGWTESGGSSGRRVSAMQVIDDTEGPCYKCGESGHKAAACRQDVGRCTACNKKGHKEAVCWRAHPEL